MFSAFIQTAAITMWNVQIVAGPMPGSHPFTACEPISMSCVSPRRRLRGVDRCCLLTSAVHHASGNILGPALAGAASRGVAGLVTAPLELARTRMQAASQQRGVGGAQQNTRFWQHLVPPPGATQLQRFTFLWTGAWLHHGWCRRDFTSVPGVNPEDKAAAC